MPLTVTGATETTHYTFGLKGNGGTGVSLDTTMPNNAQNPSVTLSGAGARTATLALTAVANTDRLSRTVAISYGTSTRAPSSTGLAGGISATGSVSVPILDDDAMVSVTAASVAEGGNMDFIVTLPDPAPTGGVTVGYSTSNGRGNASDATHQIATGADYTAASEDATITIAANGRSGTIRIATTDDSSYEGDHYFTLTLTSTSHFNLSTTAGSAIGTITDAADTPSFVFSAASTTADEGDGTVALTVQKSGTTLVDATVSYQTVDGTATGGSDFTAIASTDLVFKASESSKSFNVSPTNDSADEPAEAFTVSLTAGADAKLGSTVKPQHQHHRRRCDHGDARSPVNRHRRERRRQDPHRRTWPRAYRRRGPLCAAHLRRQRCVRRRLHACRAEHDTHGCDLLEPGEHRPRGQSADSLLLRRGQRGKQRDAHPHRQGGRDGRGRDGIGDGGPRYPQRQFRDKPWRRALPAPAPRASTSPTMTMRRTASP